MWCYFGSIGFDHRRSAMVGFCGVGFFALDDFDEQSQAESTVDG